MQSCQFVFLLGTNEGDRLSNLRRAGNLINQEVGDVTSKSSVYSTAPWGITDQDDFLNRVLVVESSLTPQKALEVTLEIERKMGRERTLKWGPRVIDIDLLFAGDLVIDEAGLTLPHPALHLRRFTLIPLNELMPGFIHPVLKLTLSELLIQCPDHLPVEKYSE